MPNARDVLFSPSQLIDARIKELGDWRGEVLSRLRTLVKEADPEIVEDQPDVLEVIEMFLDGLDYRILTAVDGVAARELLESDEAIDLLLTDVVMPNGVSGLDLAQDARRLRQDLKIILVSGYLRDIDNRSGGLTGLMFLEKPFRQTELADTIAAALGG